MESKQKQIRSKTEFVEEEEHLCIQSINIFPELRRPSQSKRNLTINKTTELETNFGIKINNPYCFCLLHLRNCTTKNPLNINIPQVCIFHDKAPFDVVYSSKGYIRGLKEEPTSRLRLKEVERFFKNSCKTKDSTKWEPLVADFSSKANKEVLMLTDNDFFITCCKPKNDSFFQKLVCFKNKIPVADSPPIHTHFPVKDDLYLLKMATQSMLGFREESTIRGELDDERYLLFLNEKIVLYLNYEHNIRINNCEFVYMKTNSGEYYLMDVLNLSFSNLTKSLMDRYKRVQQMEQERNKILIMTPEKEEKYRKYQNRPMVSSYQQIMRHQFHTMVRKHNFSVSSDNKRQAIKNQKAFKKMHPKSKFTYTELITSENFMKTKAKLFKTSVRKPITIPSKYVRRYYESDSNTFSRTTKKLS